MTRKGLFHNCPTAGKVLPAVFLTFVPEESTLLDENEDKFFY